MMHANVVDEVASLHEAAVAPAAAMLRIRVMHLLVDRERLFSAQPPAARVADIELVMVARVDVVAQPRCLVEACRTVLTDELLITHTSYCQFWMRVTCVRHVAQAPGKCLATLVALLLVVALVTVVLKPVFIGETHTTLRTPRTKCIQ